MYYLLYDGVKIKQKNVKKQNLFGIYNDYNICNKYL